MATNHKATAVHKWGCSLQIDLTDGMAWWAERKLHRYGERSKSFFPFSLLEDRLGGVDYIDLRDHREGMAWKETMNGGQRMAEIDSADGEQSLWNTIDILSFYFITLLESRLSGGITLTGMAMGMCSMWTGRELHGNGERRKAHSRRERELTGERGIAVECMGWGYGMGERGVLVTEGVCMRWCYGIGEE